MIEFKIKLFDEEITLIPKLDLYLVEDFMGRQAYNIAIILYDAKTQEHFCEITKCFPSILTQRAEFIGVKDCIYLDVNNNPFVLKMLKEHGIAEETGFTKKSGFCEYPLWHFKEEFLRELNPEMYEQYLDKYNKIMEM